MNLYNRIFNPHVTQNNKNFNSYVTQNSKSLNYMLHTLENVLGFLIIFQLYFLLS